MDNLLLVIAALLLVLLNGFFVAAEFGLVKLRQTRIRSIAKTAGLRGKLLIKVHQHLDTYLSACQLGITLASLGLGWIGEPAFANLLQPLFHILGVTSAEIIHGVSFFFAFFVISFLHIVVGELAPKSMAIRMPEKVSLWTAPALYAFYWLMYPVIWVLNSSANLVLKWVGLDVAHGSDSHYSPEELKLILRGSHGGSKEIRDEWSIMAQVLDFGGLEISDLHEPDIPVARLDAIEQEFEAIRARARAQLGAEDVAYIRRLRRHSRPSRLPGRPAGGRCRPPRSR